MAGLSPPDPVAVAARVAGILEQLEIRYVLGGSLASTAFGEPRTTLDVDLAVNVCPKDVDAFVDAVQSEFEIDREWVRDEVQRNGSFQLVETLTFIRVDVFVPKWSGFDLWKWQTRRRIVVDHFAPNGIDVTSPEAITLQKLRWFRKDGGVSERQWRDVIGVLKAQNKRMDQEAVDEWGVKLGVDELLRRARREAGED